METKALEAGGPGGTTATDNELQTSEWWAVKAKTGRPGAGTISYQDEADR